MKWPDPPTDLALRSALQVLAGGDTAHFALASEAEGVRGKVIERYAAVPSLSDPRALLPLDATPQALGTALGQHAAGAASPCARGAAHLLRLANSIGLAKPLLQQRLSVMALGDDSRETPLHEFLSEVLGQRDFVVNLRLAPRRPNGKPVAQVLARNGQALAYAKFGWECLTRRLIRHEAATLQELAPLTRGTVLHTPRVIHSGEWHGLETLVLAPLDGRGRIPRSAAGLPAAASRALAGIRPLRIERLGDSNFWKRTISRVTEFAPLLPHDTRQTILEARHAVENRWGEATLPMGQSHGDWIPPNILIRDDGGFNVWDWERSMSDVPLGVDALQFVLYFELRRHLPHHTLGRRLRPDGERALARQALDPAKLKLFVILSLLESILWRGEAMQAGRGSQEDDRLVRALAAILDEG